MSMNTAQLVLKFAPVSVPGSYLRSDISLINIFSDFNVDKNAAFKTTKLLA